MLDCLRFFKTSEWLDIIVSLSLDSSLKVQNNYTQSILWASKFESTPLVKNSLQEFLQCNFSIQSITCNEKPEVPKLTYFV